MPAKESITSYNSVAFVPEVDEQTRLFQHGEQALIDQIIALIQEHAVGIEQYHLQNYEKQLKAAAPTKRAVMDALVRLHLSDEEFQQIAIALAKEEIDDEAQALDTLFRNSASSQTRAFLEAYRFYNSHDPSVPARLAKVLLQTLTAHYANVPHKLEKVTAAIQFSQRSIITAPTSTVTITPSVFNRNNKRSRVISSIASMSTRSFEEKDKEVVTRLLDDLQAINHAFQHMDGKNLSSAYRLHVVHKLRKVCFLINQADSNIASGDLKTTVIKSQHSEQVNFDKLDRWIAGEKLDEVSTRIALQAPLNHFLANLQGGQNSTMFNSESSWETDALQKTLEDINNIITNEDVEIAVQRQGKNVIDAIDCARNDVSLLPYLLYAGKTTLTFLSGLQERNCVPEILIDNYQKSIQVLLTQRAFRPHRSPLWAVLKQLASTMLTLCAAATIVFGILGSVGTLPALAVKLGYSVGVPLLLSGGYCLKNAFTKRYDLTGHQDGLIQAVRETHGNRQFRVN